MTLLEACNELTGKIIKVGSTKGSGYFFCGKVYPTISEEFDNISDKFIIPLQKELKKKMNEKAVFDDVWDKEFEDMQSRIKAKYSYVDPEIFSKHYNNFQDKRDNAWNKLMDEINKLQLGIENFIPIGSRQVVEIYQSFFDADLILLIDGNEGGKFWMVSEYQKGDNKNE